MCLVGEIECQIERFANQNYAVAVETAPSPSSHESGSQIVLMAFLWRPQNEIAWESESSIFWFLTLNAQTLSQQSGNG